MNKCISKRLLFILFGVALLMISTLLTTFYIVRADTITPNDEDFEKALAKAPKGLSWNDKDFTLADFEKAANERPDVTNSMPNVDHKSEKINRAKIFSSSNPNNPHTSIIQMTNGTHQTGAVWSSMDNNNYFDISHDQTTSMWLYFGKNSNNDSNLNGDGMAFVLQNDSLGENAIALSGGLPVNGQSLGVWGADWDYKNHDRTKLSATAIQNSWALEFDTFNNVSSSQYEITGEGVSFDNKNPISGAHIAGNYPASPGTYLSYNSYPKNFFTLNHNNLAGKPKLVDSNWHHVTIHWNSTNSELSYKYDDKNPDTGKPIKQTPSIFKINTNNFDSTTGNPQYFNLNKGKTRLHWGFTASTGKYSENNLLIFESIPSFVDAEVTPTIYDDTLDGKEVTEGLVVDPNDDIRYKYSLNYKGWSREWNNIQATMEVPDNVKFTSGTITYPDSPINKGPRPIPKKVFEDSNTTKNVNYLLPEKLNHDSRNAIIELNGNTGRTTNKQLKVPSAHANFTGDNLITDADTVSFKIDNKSLFLESSSLNPIKIKPNDVVSIPAQVSNSSTNGKPDYTKMNVYQTLNGKTTNAGIAINSNGTFTLKIDGAEIKDAADLSFFVEDPSYYGYGTSNRVTRKIITDGGLSFGIVQPTASFKNIQSYSSNRLVPRLGKWQVDVHDSRETGSSWTVQAKATNLINGQKKLNGHLVYKDPKNDTISTLMNNPVTIATGTKEPLDTDIKNITDSWTSQNGILLAMDHP